MFRGINRTGKSIIGVAVCYGEYARYTFEVIVRFLGERQYRSSTRIVSFYSTIVSIYDFRDNKTESLRASINIPGTVLSQS